VLDHLSCFLEASFVLFKQVTICHVMSTACPRDAAPMQEGGDAVAERDAIDEGRNSGVQLKDLNQSTEVTWVLKAMPKVIPTEAPTPVVIILAP
jgi:hypothetical protein